MNLIIFTELDEIIFSLGESDYQPIAEVVENLKRRKIPLIPVSSKTRAELIPLLDRLGLTDPFIVERGSGIFVPQSDNNFYTSQLSTVDRYYLHQLGCSYTEARAALKAVQEEISKILRGFGDLDEENIQPLIGADKLAARQAKAREFSEYFLTPNRLEIEQLQSVAIEYGFKIVAGDSLSLMLGAGAEVAECIKWLKQNAISSAEELQTIGLGSAKQDLGLLEAVDVAIAIPVETEVNSSPNNYQTANSPGVSGWIESVEQICGQYL